MTTQKHHSINYIELPAQDFDKIKNFFIRVFDWSFEDYGPDYMAIHNAGLDGGFYKSKSISLTETGAALVVLYSENLEETRLLIIKAGGKVIKEIFDFPGGRRFHFTDPHGNELAVWSAN